MNLIIIIPKAIIIQRFGMKIINTDKYELQRSNR